jgi:hypothetical protein
MTEWRDDAACVRLPLTVIDRLFFPSPEAQANGDAWEEGKAICDSCPVRKECLATAQHYGLWGGEDPADRGVEGSTAPRRAKNGKSQHGTYSKWVLGCRCLPCVEAKRLYTRTQMRRRRAGNAPDRNIYLPLYNSKDSTS